MQPQPQEHVWPQVQVGVLQQAQPQAQPQVRQQPQALQQVQAQPQAQEPVLAHLVLGLLERVAGAVHRLLAQLESVAHQLHCLDLPAQ